MFTLFEEVFMGIKFHKLSLFLTDCQMFSDKSCSVFWTDFFGFSSCWLSNCCYPVSSWLLMLLRSWLQDPQFLEAENGNVFRGTSSVLFCQTPGSATSLISLKPKWSAWGSLEPGHRQLSFRFARELAYLHETFTLKIMLFPGKKLSRDSYFCVNVFSLGRPWTLDSVSFTLSDFPKHGWILLLCLACWQMLFM